MTSPRQEQATHRLMEDLLDCAAPQQRCALFLDALLREKLCASVALWRHVGKGAVRAWHPIVARGPASLLPTLDMVRGVAAGELPEELSGGRFVVLPINHRNYALAVGLGHHPAATADDDLDTIDALFHVWMAVEIAESVNQGDSLLDALPAPIESSPAKQPSPAAMMWKGWEGFLFREADALLESTIDFSAHCDDVPTLSLADDNLKVLLRELLTSSAAGFERRPTWVRVTMEDVENTNTESGVRITIEDNGGHPPSLQSGHVGRFSSGLFDATYALNAASGDFSIERRPHGVNRVSVWLPASAPSHSLA